MYVEGKRQALTGLDYSSADIRALLLMTSTTAGTENTKTTVGGFSLLDEMDGSGYARQALTGLTVTADNTNNWAYFTSSTVTFSNVAAGTRSVQAVLFIKWVTNIGLSIPLFYIDTASDGTLPFAANGSSIVIAPSATGFLKES